MKIRWIEKLIFLLLIILIFNFWHDFLYFNYDNAAESRVAEKFIVIDTGKNISSLGYATVGKRSKQNTSAIELEYLASIAAKLFVSASDYVQDSIDNSRDRKSVV